MIIDSFKTLRLEARKLCSDDYALLRLMHVDANTMETLGGVRTQMQTKENLAWNLKQWDDYHVGLWLFFERNTQQFIGTAGLRHIDIEGVLEVDLAYALLSKFWRQGYATEMAKACIDIGLHELKYSSILAGTRSTNLASQKIIEKLGFTFERKLFQYSHEQYIYRLRG